LVSHTDGAGIRADVAIVGAGPAGALAALALARAGLDVVLIDRASFPRDKTCGDALMPDALAALRKVGLADHVRARARVLDTLRIYAPDDTPVRVKGDFAVLPREQLDACLCHAAVAAGARLLAPVRVSGPVEDAGTVLGIAGRTRNDEPVRVSAAITVLATGAAAGPLKAFGMCERSEPSATAARFYWTVGGPGGAGGAGGGGSEDPPYCLDDGAPFGTNVGEPSCKVDDDALCISYERSICPGYGWIFPGPGGTFNIGVGYFYDAPPPAITSLRRLMARFLETFPPARELMARGGQASPIKGAPLRTGLAGARLGRPGLIVAGEAAGLTYPISGEGIGKAMESGLLAADIIGEGLRAGRSPAAIASQYAAALASTLSARFRAYARAQRWVAHPRLVNFLAHRANAGVYVRRQIEGLVNETAEPGAILSVSGILRSIFT
jgi:flavin-dependent dehydrogenase